VVPVADGLSTYVQENLAIGEVVLRDLNERTLATDNGR